MTDTYTTTDTDNLHDALVDLLSNDRTELAYSAQVIVETQRQFFWFRNGATGNTPYYTLEWDISDVDIDSDDLCEAITTAQILAWDAAHPNLDWLCCIQSATKDKKPDE